MITDTGSLGTEGQSSDMKKQIYRNTTHQIMRHVFGLYCQESLKVHVIYGDVDTAETRWRITQLIQTDVPSLYASFSVETDKLRTYGLSADCQIVLMRCMGDLLWKRVVEVNTTFFDSSRRTSVVVERILLADADLSWLAE